MVRAQHASNCFSGLTSPWDEEVINAVQRGLRRDSTIVGAESTDDSSRNAEGKRYLTGSPTRISRNFVVSVASVKGF